MRDGLLVGPNPRRGLLSRRESYLPTKPSHFEFSSTLRLLVASTRFTGFTEFRRTGAAVAKLGGNSRRVAELDRHGGIRDHECAGATSLDQVLVLVVVEIEVVEQGDLATAVRAQIVVAEIDDQAAENTVIVVDGAMQPVEKLDFDDLGNTQLVCKLLIVLVQAVTLGIAEQAHLGEQILANVQRRGPGTLVELARTDAGLDESLGLIGTGQGAIDDGVDGVHLVIGPNGTDVLFVNLVLSIGKAAVADEDGSSQLLVQHHAHLVLHEHDDVEVGDVDDVVTVELLQLVDGLRVGLALQDDDLLFDLLGALDVTFCTGLVAGDVGRDGLDSRER